MKDWRGYTTVSVKMLHQFLQQRDSSLLAQLHELPSKATVVYIAIQSTHRTKRLCLWAKLHGWLANVLVVV